MKRRALLQKAAAIGAALLLPLKLATDEVEEVAVDTFQPLMERVSQASTPGMAWGAIQKLTDASLISQSQRDYLMDWVSLRIAQGGY